MMELDIFCNYTQCRERLNDKALVTSCSHAFCLRHGNLSFANELVCPACKTALNNSSKYNIVRVDLNPPEDVRSMMLAGLRPEIIIDIAQRAIGFWSYQIHMENTYNIKQYHQFMTKYSQEQNLHQTHVNNFEIKMNHLKKKINDLEKQLQHQTTLSEELREKLNDKIREHASILQKYTELKKKQLYDAVKFSGLNELPLNVKNISNNDTNILGRQTNAFVQPFMPATGGLQFDHINNNTKFHYTTKTTLPQTCFMFTPKHLKKQSNTNKIEESGRRKM